MYDAPQSVSEKISQQIHRDLKPSLLIVYLKSGFAVLLGGLASLLFCGQFGVGVTHAVLHWDNQFHGHVHDIPSAFLCGVFFAVLPPFVLRTLCSPLQFRILTRKSVHAAVVWFIGLGAVLAHHGQTGAEVILFSIWALAAAVTFRGMSRLIDEVAGTWNFSLLPERDGVRSSRRFPILWQN